VSSSYFQGIGKCIRRKEGIGCIRAVHLLFEMVKTIAGNRFLAVINPERAEGQLLLRVVRIKSGWNVDGVSPADAGLN
jgi:hypothetical protein